MISIIIPVLNEEKALPATLNRIHQLHGDFEIIVVDGGSTDNTVKIAQSDTEVCLITAPKGRASQMNSGADISTGQWLLFLHADTLLPENALNTIQLLPDKVLAGGFKHRFSGQQWSLRFISFLHNLRCRITRVFYGDQAMFIRTDKFHQYGKYPEQPILEDLLFGETIAKNTTPVIMSDYVVTDSRKFEQDGIWRSLFRVIKIQLYHKFGIANNQNPFFSNIR